MREIARSSFLCGSAATAILLQQNVAQAQAMPEQRGHQNLLLDAAGAAGLRTRLKTDPFAAGLYRTLHAYSERILTQDFVAFDTATEKIHESLGQVYALGLLWRIDGEPRYAERARRILRSMAEHPDWHPADFLNVAETTHAMAIGYDWLYPILTVEERKLYVDAIVRKGLDVALALHSQQNEGGWWYKANHNWNIVCNSGIGMGALAVLPESPGKAMRCIHNSLASLPHALASYAPDGGWLEGPTYWTYATNYVMTYIAGLQSIFRHDFGLSTSPGLAETGLFRICFSGPCGDFNYSDANAQLFPAPVMFWAATKFNRPAYAWHEHSLLENPGFPHEPQHLLWLPEI